MRPEKQYLVDEVGQYLDGSNYVFLTDYTGITVSETAELRQVLSEHDAEFHVVKNRIFRVAAGDRELPDLGERLTGQTAIVCGGENAPGVAKALEKFFKEKEKVEVKGGILEKKLLAAEDVSQLAKLPPLEVVQAQFLGLLNTPAQRTVTVLQAVPQSVLNVIKAHSDQAAAA